MEPGEDATRRRAALRALLPCHSLGVNSEGLGVSRALGLRLEGLRIAGLSLGVKQYSSVIAGDRAGRSRQLVGVLQMYPVYAY